MPSGRLVEVEAVRAIVDVTLDCQKNTEGLDTMVQDATLRDPTLFVNVDKTKKTLTYIDDAYKSVSLNEVENSYDKGKAVFFVVNREHFQLSTLDTHSNTTATIKSRFYTITAKTKIGYINNEIYYKTLTIEADTTTLSGRTPKDAVRSITIETISVASDTRTQQATLSASGWSGDSYTFSADLDIYDISVRPDGDIVTSEQLTAWSNAQMVGGYAQNKIYAKGTVPTVDIPVILVLRKKAVSV